MRRTSNELPNIVKRVTFDDVAEALPDFSYDGIMALISLLEEYAEFEPIIFDEVAIRSEYSELTPSEVLRDFPHPYKDSELAELDEDELWELAKEVLESNGHYFVSAFDTLVVDLG